MEHENNFSKYSFFFGLILVGIVLGIFLGSSGWVISRLSIFGIEIAVPTFTPFAIQPPATRVVVVTMPEKTALSQATLQAIETPMPVSPEIAPPGLPKNYISLGEYYSGKADSGGKPGDQIYSHFISGKIRYSRVSADDDIKKILLVCTDTMTDITGKFFPIPKPEGEIFPQYASEVLDIPSNCRVDFFVADTLGVQTMIIVSAEAVVSSSIMWPVWYFFMV